MSYRFELGVWTPNDAVMPIAQYLRGVRTDELHWRPSPDSSALFLESLGQDWLSTWNFGELGRMVRQLENARQRLVGNREAIVRSAVDDQPTVPYLLFEPSADEVIITLFFIEDYDLGATYPLPGGQDNPETLYTFVREQRPELVSALPEDLRAEAFESVPLPYDLMLDSLDRESTLGHEMLDLLRKAPG